MSIWRGSETRPPPSYRSTSNYAVESIDVARIKATHSDRLVQKEHIHAGTRLRNSCSIRSVGCLPPGSLAHRTHRSGPACSKTERAQRLPDSSPSGSTITRPSGGTLDMTMAACSELHDQPMRAPTSLNPFWNSHHTEAKPPTDVAVDLFPLRVGAISNCF